MLEPLPTHHEEDLLERAMKLVIESQNASLDILQRELRISYARAAEIVDRLEHWRIVGPFRGSEARDVLESTFPPHV